LAAIQHGFSLPNQCYATTGADSEMIETTGVAIVTFFATIGPLGVSAMFAALTASTTAEARRAMAVRGTLIAAAILLGFALLGENLLTSFGISLAALKTAGSILLLLIGIDRVFARSSGGTSTTDEETQEAEVKQDISVFPLATPLLAGPGAMGATILLMANAEGNLKHQAMIVVSLLAVCF
jgi:multiple antibiotic resistance protein